jgi:hypothetical protein
MLIEVSVANMDEFLKIMEKVESGQSSNIPLILHLLRTGFLDSLVITETKFLKHGEGGMVEVRLTPTPLLKFLTG